MAKNHSHNTENHIIIGIGASAGGLQALKDFFDNVPHHSPYTYIVVQHLSPDHKSLMAELLSKNTKIPIIEILDDSEIKMNCIYLIPPTKNLIIENQHLRLLDKPKGMQLNLPINLFFESLAEYSGQNCAGIILSGTGSDGSRGIKAIKEKGGVVMVQTPEQAKFDGMPKSAINTGCADFIVPVEQMSDELVTFFKTANNIEFDTELVNYEEHILNEILQVLKQNTALDFGLYKRPTLLRRIAKRMRVVKTNSLEEYLTYIKIETDEIQVLYNEFLIGVTKFYRDYKAWETLENKVIPDLVRSKEEGDILKIWEVGCSTGEEAYSLAISFKEEIEAQQKDIKLKIFATDISQDHLDIAGNGSYEEGVAGDISVELLEKYFEKDELNNYKVKDSIRKSVIFSNHNIVQDPPFKNMDMVVCRNLLIYLQNSVQNKVIQVLHYALSLKGILFLGSSESLGVHEKYFNGIDRKWKIFENKQVSKRLRSEILKSTANRLELKSYKKASKDLTPVPNSVSENLKIDISDAVIEHFGATSIFVDDELNVMEAMGAFRKYAAFPESGFSTNLLQMVPEELKGAITTAVRRAVRSKNVVFYKDALVNKEKVSKTVDLLVKPLQQTVNESKYNFIITLIEKEIKEDGKTIFQKATTNKTSQERIKDLEEELGETQMDLKRALEEAETSNEELQAANEELLASNEELQSTNEELQSVNEELHTVNAEYIQKMEDLAQLNADMDNLLDSTRIGTVFLDKDLRIRKFTPAVKEHFKLMKQDIGRSIDNFIANFGIGKKANLLDNSKKVMRTSQVFEKNIRSKSGRYFIQRISPFVSSEGKVDGVVITFIDITKVHKSQEELRKSEEKFKAFYEDDPVMHVSINSSTGTILECNKLLVETLGFADKKDLIGRSVFDFYTRESKLKAVEIQNSIRDFSSIKNEEMIMIAKDGREIPIMLNSDVSLDEQGNPTIVRSALVDISELKVAQTALQQQKDDLERINKDLEQFVSICSHDLQEPLSTIRFSSDFISKKFSDELNEKGKEYLGYIHEASGRMADQIKALLEHSRIGQDLKKTKVNIAELVEIVKYDLSRRIKECDAQIHVGKMPNLKVYQTELRLLFQNLIGNAIKYNRKGVKPEIRISAFQEGSYWTFAITDNGIGIKEEDLDSIFKIFGRVPTEEKYEGTGVGLAHCDKIVKLHDGKIWVESQYGVGSTFYFKIKV
ncbi:chemotaxis protein CheB [Leeuwenhoekiella sp. A16]|uniref:chemotaxis protein CheB n=1 Tax=unclassified Leeuwenhoekiella TaxID=2615029 RepID=UPI003A7F8069